VAWHNFCFINKDETKAGLLRFKLSAHGATMDTVSSTTGTSSVQPVTSTQTQSSSTDTASASSDFATVLKSLLGSSSAKDVNEEEIFAGLIEERLKTAKSSTVASQYHDLLTAKEQAMKTSSGYIPFEDAARSTLMDMVKSGTLTSAEADQVHSDAFAAAQLDGNANALYDSIGGTGNDLTKAVMGIDEAMAKCEAQLKKFVDGTETSTVRALAQAFSANGTPIVNPYDTSVNSKVAGAPYTGASQTVSPQGSKMDGTDGFLFKPVSQHGGDLAILLPASLSTSVSQVLLKDSSGNVIEEGTHWAPGFGAEGDPATARKKFSFKKPGASYPKNISVDVVMNNGSIVSYKIPDPSKRYD
jgi:hypothetical protein